MFEVYCDCSLYAIVAGGDARAGISSIQTVWCPECKVLQDIVTATEAPESGEITRYPIRCDVCGTTDAVVWKRGQPCPNCGGQVIMKAGGDAVISPD